MKIFSGKKSEAFWQIINHRMKNKTDSDIMYNYGIKAQELEAENARLKEKLKNFQKKIKIIFRGKTD